jgi:hypothetical protein
MTISLSIATQNIAELHSVCGGWSEEKLEDAIA